MRLDAKWQLDALLDMAALVARSHEEAAGLIGLTASQAAGLLAVERAGEDGVCAVARAIDATQPAASYLLAILEDRGLVTQRRAEDARKVVVELTEEGSSRLGLYRRSASKSLGAAFDNASFTQRARSEFLEYSRNLAGSGRAVSVTTSESKNGR